MGPLMLVLDQPDKATDRRESSEKPGGESGSTRDWQRRREWFRPGLLTKFFNERTRRVTTTLVVCLRVEKEVVLDGGAAGFSAALDSRQAAAKRADRDRRARTPHSAVRSRMGSFSQTACPYNVSALPTPLAKRIRIRECAQ